MQHVNRSCPWDPGLATGKVGGRAACRYQSQSVETRIEPLQALYSDAAI